MIRDDAEKLVAAALTTKDRSLLLATIKLAYENAHSLCKAEPILQVLSAQINQGHVIAWSVDFHVERLLKVGGLNYNYNWQNFARPTGKFLEVVLGTCTLSFNQVPRSHSFPRDAVFRDRYTSQNQLFLDWDELAEERQKQGLPHLFFTHGHHNLRFCHIGIGSPYSQWIYQTPNLLDGIQEVSIIGPKVEATNIELELSLKEVEEHLIEMVQDYDT